MQLVVLSSSLRVGFVCFFSFPFLFPISLCHSAVPVGPVQASAKVSSNSSSSHVSDDIMESLHWPWTSALNTLQTETR